MNIVTKNGVYKHDLTGKTFNRLTAVRFSHRGPSKQTYWIWRCDCGTEKPIIAANVINGHTTSCGCAANSLPPRKDLTGKVFGMLTVIRYSRRDNRRARWLCRCECGTEKLISVTDLTTGNSVSCGCRKRYVLGDSRRTHGRTGTKEHNVWCGMRQRCCNPGNPAYKDYGGRGITVCKRWLDSFEAFLEDMGPCPENCSIDRINNDDGYAPGNCRWALRETQANNNRRNQILTVNDCSMTIAEWSRKVGIKSAVIWTRINKMGWSAERAVTETPATKVRPVNRMLEFNGRSQTIAEWSRESHIPVKTLYARVRAGWDAARVIKTPVDTRFGPKKAVFGECCNNNW